MLMNIHNVENYKYLLNSFKIFVRKGLKITTFKMEDRSYNIRYSESTELITYCISINV